MKWVNRLLKKLEAHVSSPWFPLAIGIVAYFDNFLFIIPMAAVLITAIISSPKRWFSIALGITIGTVLGAITFAFFVSHFGTSFLHSIAPKMMELSLWNTALHWLEQYGLWALFLVSCLPVSDHPLIALAALTHLPLLKISLVLGVAKTLKFFLLSWLASHAPSTLLKFKVLEKEVKEIQPKD